MKNKINVFGILFIALGIFLAVGIQWIFPACGPTDSCGYLKCHWGSQAVLASGLYTAALAVVFLVSKDAAAKGVLGIAEALAGVYNILVFDLLVGVCDMPTMQCRTTTQPAVNLISVVLIVLGVVAAVLVFRSQRGGERKAGPGSSTEPDADSPAADSPAATE